MAGNEWGKVEKDKEKEKFFLQGMTVLTHYIQDVSFNQFCNRCVLAVSYYSFPGSECWEMMFKEGLDTCSKPEWVQK